jgi:hypothetical protein
MSEEEQLRAEVRELREKVLRLEGAVDALAKRPAPTAPQVPYGWTNWPWWFQPPFWYQNNVNLQPVQQTIFPTWNAGCANNIPVTNWQVVDYSGAANPTWMGTINAGCANPNAGAMVLTNHFVPS